jgi:hypothetical protein
MEYYNEIITIESLLEDTRAKKNTKPESRNENNIKSDLNQKNSYNQKGESLLLKTKEACEFLNCSPTTLWNYAKAGIIKPWQRKKRGLTRWHISELKRT